MSKGLKRDTCLTIIGLSKNQFYYISNGRKPGKRPSLLTRYRDPKTLEEKMMTENQMVMAITTLKTNPDHGYWYRLITKTLQINGYYVNHKKVFRIMTRHVLLEDKKVSGSRDYVQFRRVTPTNPLEVIEMDIKYVWISGARKYAFVLTVIDTFTRYVLDYSVGYSMTSLQIQQSWEYIISTYYQPLGLSQNKIDIEVRSDNGKQFSSKVILDFFKENKMQKVFTHPYTPEENAHVESFNKTLGKAIEFNTFHNLKSLEDRLVTFYECYNNDRSHGSTKGIPPAKFWTLFEQNQIEVITLPKHRIKFKVKVKYQDILLLEGIEKHDYRAKMNSE